VLILKLQDTSNTSIRGPEVYLSHEDAMVRAHFMHCRATPNAMPVGGVSRDMAVQSSLTLVRWQSHGEAYPACQLKSSSEYGVPSRSVHPQRFCGTVSSGRGQTLTFTSLEIHPQLVREFVGEQTISPWQALGHPFAVSHRTEINLRSMRSATTVRLPPLHITPKEIFFKIIAHLI